jgi:LmbE family N-acetylglucosaminyl deacetylase
VTAAGTLTPRPFSHREPGTDEPTWLLDARWDGVPRCDLAALVARCPRVVLIAPHPDDETLALGATLADLAASGIDVTVVVATHGGKGPGATVRRAEGDAAIATLGPAITARWWDLPDGRLSRCEAQIADRLAALAGPDTLLLAPAEYDGHADHDAVGRAAATVARQTGAHLLHYPVWLWHWAIPDDLPWVRLRTLAPSLNAQHTKTAALAQHRSQLTADADGSPIVGTSVQARALRTLETVLLPAGADLAARVEWAITTGPTADQIAQPFDAMYRDGDHDPWQLDTSFYERRRHQLVLAVLGRERYDNVLDIGCATGQHSIALRTRANRVTGLDASASALAVAFARGAGDTGLHWRHGTAPHDIPAERFDLIVLSEVAYFLDGPDLLSTLRTVRRALRPGGEIVLADWRYPTGDIPLDGPTAHRQVTAALDLPRRARYEDADLLVEVWGEPLSTYDSHRSRT